MWEIRGTRGGGVAPAGGVMGWEMRFFFLIISSSSRKFGEKRQHSRYWAKCSRSYLVESSENEITRGTSKFMADGGAI
jgi:hypothetical protein